MEDKDRDKNKDMVILAQIINEMQHKILKDELKRQKMEYNMLVFFGVLTLTIFIGAIICYSVGIL